MHATMQDAAALIRTAYAVAGVDATAGGTGDADEVDCAYVDRRIAATDGSVVMAQSLKCVIVGTATLQEDETISIAANLQDDADGSGAGTDFGTALVSAVQATGDTSGSTETFTVELDFDLSAARRYVRLQFTPYLSASGTDTAELSAIYVLCGAADQPITDSAI